jgi:hypothetical protein
MLCFLAGLVGAAFVDRRQVFAKRRWRKSSLLVVATLSAVLATLGSALPAQACGEAISRCASLETALLPSAPSRFFALHSWEPRAPGSAPAPLFFTAQAHYQRRPLTAEAPSPDPFGREVPLLTDWLTVSALISWQFQQRWAVGLALPLSLPLSGTGLDGIASQRSQSPAAISLGDPDLVAHFTVLQRAAPAGALRLGVVQRLSLPLGSTESFLRHSGPRYAPSLAAAWDVDATTVGVELGARLRQRETLADTSFGSEAWFALGVSQRLPLDLAVAAEAWALPSLTRDEQRFLDGSTVRLQRVPSEWLLSVAWQHAQQRYALAVGSSLPLTVREAAQSERFAGPPGPVLRVGVKVERRF